MIISPVLRMQMHCALASSAAARRFEGGHPGPPSSTSHSLGMIQAIWHWQRTAAASSPTLVQRRLRSAAIRTLLVSRTRTNQSDRPLSLSSSLEVELFADRPQTAGVVIQPFQTVARYILISSVHETKAHNRATSFSHTYTY